MIKIFPFKLLNSSSTVIYSLHKPFLIIKKIADLNDAISKDSSLGDGFVIGHSYFCNLKEANKEAFLISLDNSIVIIVQSNSYIFSKFSSFIFFISV